MTKHRKLKSPSKIIPDKERRKKFAAELEKINKKYHQVLRRLAK